MNKTTYRTVFTVHTQKKVRWLPKLLLVWVLLFSSSVFAQFPAPYCDVDVYQVEEITKVRWADLEIVNADYTSFLVNRTADVATVTAGQSYAIEAEGNTYDMANEFLVFIDWNHNGILDDTGEVYYLGSLNESDGTDGQLVSLNITVPTTAVAGETRIRVTKTWTEESLGAELNQDPCFISYFDFDWGETDSSFGQALDFTLLVDSEHTTPVVEEGCLLELNFTFPEYGDVMQWKLRDDVGAVVLSGGPYDSWDYYDFSISASYQAVNPPYTLEVSIADGEYGACDNEVYYSVAVGGIADISGTVSATCDEDLVETFPIGACPTGCISPFRLTATQVTVTGFTLGWTGSGNQFEIEYGPIGFVQGSDEGTLVTNVTTTSYLFADLESTEALQFYVRRICSDDEETSAWSTPLVVDFFLVVPSPWHEDFNEEEALPLGWEALTGATWQFAESDDYGISMGVYLYDFSPFFAEVEASLSTVSIGPILEGDTFSFDYLMLDDSDSGAPAGLGTIVIEITRDGGVNYTSFDTIGSNGANDWQTFTKELDAYVGEIIKIRVKTSMQGSYEGVSIILDNFDISGGATCEAIEGASVEVTPDAVQLTIESEATAFEIEYGPTGFELGAGTTVRQVSVPYVFTSLALSTTYDVYIRPLGCEDFYGPVTFTTLALREQVISVEDVTKVYGAESFVAGASDSGLPLQYAVADTTVAVFENGKLAIKGVGTTEVTASQAGNTVYLPAEEVTFTLTVTKAMLSVTADPNQKKRYGSVDPVLTYTVTGLQYADTRQVITGALAREAGEEIATYAITPGTLNGGGNYTLTLNPENFEILPVILVVRADHQTKEYGTADPILTYQVNGLLPGDAIADVLTGALTRPTGENVGLYEIQVGTLALSSAYYDLVFHSGEFSITPADLIIIPQTGLQKVYGQIDPLFGYTVTGFKFNDTSAILTGTLNRQPGENVGTYGYGLGGLRLASNNYTLVMGSQESFRITSAPLDIVVLANQTKRFGTADPVFEFNAIGLQRGDVPIAVTTGRLIRQAGEEIGSYPIEQGSLNTRANYHIVSFTGADFEIVEGQITGLTLPSRTFNYDGDVKALEVHGNIHPDATIAYANNNQTEVGVYQVTATVDYGPAYASLTLEGILTIEKTNQTIDFDVVSQVVLEDTPTLQLAATASSSLPVSYRIDPVTEREVATLDERGVLRFMRTGFVTVLAYQGGDGHYHAASPVSKTIEVVSRKASIENLIVDGVSYGKPTPEVYVVIGCEGTPQDQVIIEVQVEEGIEVYPSKYLVVPVLEYGRHEQLITVTSAQGLEQETYKVVIEKRIATDRIVYQKYDHVLFVNNNKETNGGFVFSAYQWFKDGVAIGKKQAYSPGGSIGDVLEVGATYHVELTLHNGKTIVSCPIVLEPKAQASWSVSPNPVKKNQMLHVRLDGNQQEAVGYVIYDVKGQMLKSGTFGEGTPATYIEIPTTMAAGSYFLVLNKNGTQQSVQFIVRE